MNLQQLITFSTVISEGSMTAAAEKLYLTQPAVSQQIRNLEDEMKVNLLDRGSRHAKPTVQGQMLYDYAKRIIALTQQAQVAIQTMGEGVKGALRIGTLNSLGLQLISPAISGFMKHNSKIGLAPLPRWRRSLPRAHEGRTRRCDSSRRKFGVWKTARRPSITTAFEGRDVAGR